MCASINPSVRQRGHQRPSHGGCTVGGSRGRRPPSEHFLNRVENLASGVALTEITRATHRVRLLAKAEVIERCNEENCRPVSRSAQLFLQFESGHAGQLYIKHQAIESGSHRIGKEGLGRRISDGAHAYGTQQTRERPTQIFIVIDDSHENVTGGGHPTSVALDRGTAMLPVGEVPLCKRRCL
jgi:hypothetical protein